MVEHLGLARLGRGDQVLVEDLEDVVADLGQLVLNLLAVLLDKGDLGRVALRLLFLLDRSDYSPGGTASANDVLVGDGEEVALLDGQVAVLGGDDLHVLNHLCVGRHQSAPSDEEERRESPKQLTLISLSLLGELGQVNSIFVTHFDGRFFLLLWCFLTAGLNQSAGCTRLRWRNGKGVDGSGVEEEGGNASG